MSHGIALQAVGYAWLAWLLSWIAGVAMLVPFLK